MIYSTENYQRVGWVGLKKSKTWWRNTWMVPYILLIWYFELKNQGWKIIFCLKYIIYLAIYAPFWSHWSKMLSSGKPTFQTFNQSKSISSTLRCQINESTRLAFLDFSPNYWHFFHPTWFANFPSNSFIGHFFPPKSFIWPYSFIKFA